MRKHWRGYNELRRRRRVKRTIKGTVLFIIAVAILDIVIYLYW